MGQVWERSKPDSAEDSREAWKKVDDTLSEKMKCVLFLQSLQTLRKLTNSLAKGFITGLQLCCVWSTEQIFSHQVYKYCLNSAINIFSLLSACESLIHMATNGSRFPGTSWLLTWISSLVAYPDWIKGVCSADHKRASFVAGCRTSSPFMNSWAAFLIKGKVQQNPKLA